MKEDVNHFISQFDLAAYYHINQNYNNILESDWLSTGPI